MFQLTTTQWVVLGIRGLILLVFLIVGGREVARLFFSPARGLGTGLGRIWAVARAALLESWAARLWLLPILWLVSSAILLSVVRPTFPEDQMPQDIKMLLAGQELLVLLMMWVVASCSLPRERERKIIMTTASKPLSRLEILLGKMTGFSVAAGLSLLVMGLLSWGILEWENHRIRTEAGTRYQTAAHDYEVRQKEDKKLVSGEKVEGANDQAGKLPPNESDKILAENGMLFAYNFVQADPGQMSVVGRIDTSVLPPRRWLKGGSYEMAVYTFSPRLEIPDFMVGAPAGLRPVFTFEFPVTVFASNPPGKVVIRVTATRASTGQPMTPLEKELTLDDHGRAYWEPDEMDLYSVRENKPDGELVIDTGPVTLEVSCQTPGVYLEVLDGGMDPATGELRADRPPNVNWYLDRRGLLRPSDVNPVIRGFARRDKQETSGPKKTDAAIIAGGVTNVPVEAAVFHFRGDQLKNIPLDHDGNFQIALNLDVFKSENADQDTTARLAVISYDLGHEAPFRTDFTVREKQQMLIDVPGKYLGREGEKRGDMMVELLCTQWDHSIQLTEDSVRIDLGQSFFAWNLLKSELVIFFEAVLLIAISVTWSVRLGWPVAMLCTGVCYIFGWSLGFIVNTQGYGGLGAINYRPLGQSSAAFQVLDKLASGLWTALAAIASVMPDFTRYSSSDYIATFQNMPNSVLFWHAVWTAIFLVPFVGLGYLMFRRQEVG